MSLLMNIIDVFAIIGIIVLTLITITLFIHFMLDTDIGNLIGLIICGWTFAAIILCSIAKITNTIYLIDNTITMIIAPLLILAVILYVLEKVT